MRVRVPPLAPNSIRTKHIMNKHLREILVILQEESAEVIQEVSKCFRFGLDGYHKSGPTHREMLQNEIGDVLAMIDLLVDEGVVSTTGLEQAKAAKIEKLKIWSKIFS